MTADTTIALDLFVRAFGGPRTPRSPAYQGGAKAALQRIFEGGDMTVPYAPGTCEFDAYIAGRLEGHQIAAAHLATCAAWGVPA